MKHCSLWVMILLLLLLGGCGVGGTIRASDFDQSCATDDDCVVVSEGDKCVLERCSCGNASINEDALADFENAYALTPCIPDLTECSECLCALPPQPVCDDGLCVLPPRE